MIDLRWYAMVLLVIATLLLIITLSFNGGLYKYPIGSPYNN